MRQRQNQCIGIFIVAILLLSSSFSLYDNLYVFIKNKSFPKIVQPKNNRATIKGVELGRYLFYDPILSLNGDMSCASCHKQENAFGHTLNYRLGVADYLKLKNKRDIIPLFNLVWSSSFFWDGRSKSLEDQILHPVRNKNEMALNWLAAEHRIKESPFYKRKFEEAFSKGVIDSINISKAIAQFLRTIISDNSKFDKAVIGEALLTKDELEGFNLMKDPERGNCFSCHSTTANGIKNPTTFGNNGLDGHRLQKGDGDKGLGELTNRKKDFGKFKIPTLRNLLYTEPYMHDGRFESLENVIDFYNYDVKSTPYDDRRMKNLIGGKSKFSSHERICIIKFLLTLTDSSLIRDKKYSNPWNEKTTIN